MDLVEMTAICENNRTTIAYLRDQNLLRRTYLCCQTNCNEVKSKSSDGTEFRCNLCRRRYSIRTGSFFFNVHVALRYILLILYLFSTKTSVMQCAKYLCKKVNRKSIRLVQFLQS